IRRSPKRGRGAWVTQSRRKGSGHQFALTTKVRVSFDSCIVRVGRKVLRRFIVLACGCRLAALLSMMIAASLSAAPARAQLCTCPQGFVLSTNEECVELANVAHTVKAQCAPAGTRAAERLKILSRLNHPTFADFYGFGKDPVSELSTFDRVQMEEQLLLQQ